MCRIYVVCRDVQRPAYGEKSWYDTVKSPDAFESRRNRARALRSYRRRWFLGAFTARLCQTLSWLFLRFSMVIEASPSEAAARLAAMAADEEAAADAAERVMGVQALFSSLYPFRHELISQTPDTQATPSIPTMAVQSIPADRPCRGC